MNPSTLRAGMAAFWKCKAPGRRRERFFNVDINQLLQYLESNIYILNLAHQMDIFPLRILDKKIQLGQQIYLLHMAGDSHTKAQWLPKPAISTRFPSFLPQLHQYDKQLDKHYRKLTGTFHQRLHKKQQRNEDADAERQSHQKNRQRRPKFRGRLKQQIFEQAKQQVKEQRGNYTLRAQDFVLYIKTPLKLQQHWHFGDNINRILSKAKGQAFYQVEWKDGSKANVRQQQLIEKECEKFCDFWESKLRLYGKKR